MRSGVIKERDTGACDIDIDIISKAFQNTRKHKRLKRIVADSFIVKAGDTFWLTNVKNSKIDLKVNIDEADADRLISKLCLVGKKEGFGNDDKTYRTKAGWDIIEELYK